MIFARAFTVAAYLHNFLGDDVSTNLDEKVFCPLPYLCVSSNLRSSLSSYWAVA